MIQQMDFKNIISSAHLSAHENFFQKKKIHSRGKHSKHYTFRVFLIRM